MSVTQTMIDLILLLTSSIVVEGSTWNYGHCLERSVRPESCYDPDHWSMHYESCQGDSQSPIDISDPIKANIGCLKFQNYAKYFNDIKIENNGHSLQLNKLNKGFFRLQQPKISGDRIPLDYYD